LRAASARDGRVHGHDFASPRPPVALGAGPADGAADVAAADELVFMPASSPCSGAQLGALGKSLR
jgi:hypothetical protein